MSTLPLIIIVLICFFGLLAIGTPIVFILGGLSIIFSLFFWGPGSLLVMVNGSLSYMTSSVLLAVPLFIFMGNMMQFSGMAERLFNMCYAWVGKIKGGLGISVIGICAIVGAMIGDSGPATIVMGTIGLPAMRKAGYDKLLSIGAVAVGGVLTIIIPPSIPMIFYGMLAQISIGKLFMAALLPGFLMAALYMLYIVVRCHLQPGYGPASPSQVNWKEKFKMLGSVIDPIIIVILVLGGIYTGKVTPTEAAGLGALAVLISALARRSLSWKKLEGSVFSTFRLCGMIFFLIVAAIAFSHMLAVLRIQDIFISAVKLLPLSPMVIMIGIMVLVFILGCLMDDAIIILLFTPIFVPLTTSLHINPLWFGILFMININIAWVSPPYGFNLFYMKAIVRDEASMGEIYRSVLPFIGCQLVCLILVMIFPQIALFIPGLMSK
jgi:tripartite ATP-independent transporter DctM subunit